jgi:hypothetical protein
VCAFRSDILHAEQRQPNNAMTGFLRQRKASSRRDIYLKSKAIEQWAGDS